MTIARTVLGDVPVEELGITYAHEHLIIDGGLPVKLQPDFDLGDVDRAVEEVRSAGRLGLRTVVDAMPADAGRNVCKLAAIARTAPVHLIAPTGLHLEKYYDEFHWSRTATPEELGQLFAADVTEGIDEHDYHGPLVRRTEYRAGVIKIAGDRERLTELQERIFEGAAIAHRLTGVPILTHCEAGTAALVQIETLRRHGVPPEHVILSHVDKVVDRGYQVEVLSTGAFAEYDQGFRWPTDSCNGTLELLEWMAEDGLLGQVVLGMDAARRRYWRAYGGGPGLEFLLGDFSRAMRQRGLGDAELEKLFVGNPARAYGFATPSASDS